MRFIDLCRTYFVIFFWGGGERPATIEHLHPDFSRLKSGTDNNVVYITILSDAALTRDGDEFVFEKQADESSAGRYGLVGQGGRHQRGQERRSRIGHEVGQMTAGVFARNHGV